MKVTVRRRFYWAILYQGNRQILFRFRNHKERNEWFRGKTGSMSPVTFISATHPAVRQINRRIHAGEEILFPVEIG